MQRPREVTDAGQSGGTEGLEGANGIVFTLTPVSASTALVAGVEKAAQFFGLRQVGIHFVEQKSWLVLVDQAEKDRGGNVFGAQGPWRHGRDEIEGGSFAAIGIGRIKVETRRMRKARKQWV
jgi:hypothetical protein